MTLFHAVFFVTSTAWLALPPTALARLSRVPDSGVIVRGDAVHRIKAADVHRVRITDIGIVPGSGMSEWIGAEPSGRHRVLGHLRESTDMVGDGPAPEETRVRHHNIVVAPIGR